MLLVALAVKLDSPGPVFYRQVRVGEGGRRFTIVKFRSMRVDAEASGAPQWASEHDPRVTRVGAFIRRFRIDELPSVVERRARRDGARRPAPGASRAGRRDRTPSCPSTSRATSCAPASPGWAQVYAPYAASIEETLEKLSYDLYYVKHQSFATDAGIMLSTLGSHGRRSWGPLAAERQQGRLHMRITRFIIPLVALALCVMPAVALASGSGTTQAIVKDVAKDGKVDGHYTQAQLQAALKSPLLKQYGGQAAVESVVTNTAPTTAAAPATGVAHDLPFTGSDVFLFVGVGGGLLVAGLVLRRFGRRDDEASALAHPSAASRRRPRCPVAPRPTRFSN